MHVIHDLLCTHAYIRTYMVTCMHTLHADRQTDRQTDGTYIQYMHTYNMCMCISIHDVCVYIYI